MIRLPQPHLPVVTISDRGRQRQNNEDRLRVSGLARAHTPEQPLLLAVLADGMGGHQAGEVAAELAVTKVEEYVIEHGDTLPPIPLLVEALRYASQVIYTQGQRNPDQSGMGATCTCALIQEKHLYIANVGDSRVYLIRNGHPYRLSVDHTWVQEALDNGWITREEAIHHPQAHMIRQFLGSANPPEVDVRLRLSAHESDQQSHANQGLLLESGDVVLLCSDGLSDLVEDEEMAHLLTHWPPESATKLLVDLANQRGGHDNISLIVISVP